ncbi:MAG: hypothetical protein ABI663_15655 [Chryseolinea sp.]
MKKIIPFLILILLSCSQKEKPDALAAADSTIHDTTTIPQSPTEIAKAPNWSAPVVDITGVDSLFNILARKQIVRGTLGDVALITNKLLDPAALNDSRNLLAVLIHSGEGEGYQTEFETEYSILAVFEQRDGQVTLLDYADLGEVTNYGLQKFSMEADSIMLAENRFAIMVHNKSSEEGAGDSGYRRDFAQLYVFLNNKLINVFEKTIDDFSFASDESDYYRETTITTTLTILPEKTNDLFNIQVTTVGDNREISDKEDTESKDATEEAGDGKYQWNGKVYEKVN